MVRPGIELEPVNVIFCEDNGDELGIGLTVNSRAVMSCSSSCSPSLGKPTPDFVSVFLSNSEALKTYIYFDFVWRMC